MPISTPLAGLAYIVLYLGFIVTSPASGLYAWILRRPPWITLFSWTWSAMSVPELRLLHFFLMFIYGAFACSHDIYSATLFDIEEHNGEAVEHRHRLHKANLLDVGTSLRSRQTVDGR